MAEAGDGRFAAYWRRAVGLETPLDRAAAAEAAARLTPVFGPSLARSPVADLLPADPDADADAAFRRLLLARQTETLNAVRESGLGVLAIKGFDAARRYQPPALRILGDLDLLVRPRDLRAAVQRLQRLGFGFEASPQGALGVTADISFHPLVSPDGLVSVDLHTALDAFPLSAALDAEAVFAAVVGGDRDVLAPHHAAIAAISNAAKERFAPYAWRHLVDLGRLALQQSVDWPAVDRVVVAAGLGPARDTAVGTLGRLGVPTARLPRSVRRESRSARRLAAELSALRIVPPGRLAKAMREVAWCYAPATLVRLWRFRIAGLLRPRSGLPPEPAGGASDQT